MRRVLAPLVVALVAAGVSGCAGAEGQQAQELLLQSEQAVANAFGAAFEDTRAVIYLSEVTHLPMRGLLDMTVKVLDESVTMHLDYALEGVNEPVKIPNPA